MIDNGDPNAIPVAERAIDDYLEATPAAAHKSGLRLIQQGVLNKHKAGVGVQRSFAETVNVYIEKRLAEK